MFSFQDKIIQNINNEILNYIGCISDKYSIPREELLDIWNSKDGKPIKINNTPKKKEVVPKKVDVKVCQKVEDGCPYVFKRGKNKGMRCGCKGSKNSKYCSKHKKYEKKEPKEKKNVVPVAVKKQTVIRMNKKINKFWHPETRLVFKSKEERIVIGKCSDKNVIKPLNQADIKICQARSFAYTEPVAEEKKIKNDVQKAIFDVNIQAHDIENILNELQLDKNDSSDEEGELLEEED